MDDTRQLAESKGLRNESDLFVKYTARKGKPKP